MDSYRSAQWAKFRAEVLRLDGYACTLCGKKAADGAKLHVHHKRYLPGHKPWEYPHNMCDTLCAGCHAVEHGVIPPTFGWDLIGCDDLGELAGSCEYCGNDIRYTFMLAHPKWRALEVGSDCCDNLTCTKEASNHAESLKRYHARRKTFVSSPRWRRDYPNGEMTRQHKHVRVSLAPEGALFRLRINYTLGKKTFDSELDAKAAAFDLIESGALNAWLAKPRKQSRLRR